MMHSAATATRKFDCMTHVAVTLDGVCYDVGLWDDGTVAVALRSKLGGVSRYLHHAWKPGTPVTSPTARKVLAVAFGAV